MEKNITVTENYPKFDEMLSASINEALQDMLGEKGAKSTYYFAENGYGITRTEVAKDVQKFQTILKDLFKLGSVLLEQKIMEKVYSKVQVYKKNITLDYKNFDELDFINYIDSLKSAYNNNSFKSNNTTIKSTKNSTQNVSEQIRKKNSSSVYL